MEKPVSSSSRKSQIQYCIQQNLKDLWRLLKQENPGASDHDIVSYLHETCSNVASEFISNKSSGDVSAPEAKNPVRVYVDGCFDIMHSGHYNALRQAKSLGDVLVVGVHSDEEITKQKGPPVMNNEERLAAVKACKWVEEVVFGTPYQPTIELLDRLKCDFVVHGDDMPICADGCDAYEEVRQAGRLRIIRRTYGVSTTDLVGRLLIMTRDHHMPNPFDSLRSNEPSQRFISSQFEHSNSFHATGRRISQFSNNKSPSPEDVIVYIAGSFDLFHIGHVETLKQAKKLGTYLYVGVHEDQTVNRIHGSNLPIMNLHERVLNVLSCKEVDDVVICAPWIISEHLIKSLNIAIVASGGNVDGLPDVIDGVDRFSTPKALGIHQVLTPKKRLTTNDVMQRIVDNRFQYENKHRKRSQKEAEYKNENQYNVAEV